MARLAFLEFLVLTSLVVNPCAKFRGFGIVGWNNATSVAFTKLRKLSNALQPSCFVCIPAEINTVQLLSPLLGHVRLLSLFHDSVVSSLFFDPKTEFGVLGMVQGNVAVSMLFTESLEVFHVAVPGGFLGIPCKLELIEHGNPFSSDATLFTIFHEFVLFSGE